MGVRAGKDGSGPGWAWVKDRKVCAHLVCRESVRLLDRIFFFFFALLRCVFVLICEKFFLPTLLVACS